MLSIIPLTATYAKSLRCESIKKTKFSDFQLKHFTVHFMQNIENSIKTREQLCRNFPTTNNEVYILFSFQQLIWLLRNPSQINILIKNVCNCASISWVKHFSIILITSNSNKKSWTGKYHKSIKKFKMSTSSASSLLLVILIILTIWMSFRQNLNKGELKFLNFNFWEKLRETFLVLVHKVWCSLW